MSRAFAVAVCVSGSFALACAYSDQDRESITQLGSEIIGGSTDATHQAVVTVLTATGMCSGTIVHATGGKAYVLTAAHCKAPTVIRQGDDHKAPQFTYPIVRASVHPLYGQNYYDFQMIEASYSGEMPPAIPAMNEAEDALKVGSSSVDIVGYGSTQADSNSIRNHVVKTLSAATATHLAISQQSGGICSGDSGGPWLANVGDERVAGVSQGTSSPDCASGAGLAGRVSAIHDSFIWPFINGQPFGKQTCSACRVYSLDVGVCNPVYQACRANADCKALLTCFGACSNQPCLQACADDHALGYQYYLDASDCACEIGCATECQGNPLCPPKPACGLTSSHSICTGCMETQCCAQAAACADDNACAACFAPKPPAGCETNALANTLKNCFDSSCGADCSPGGTAGEGGEWGDGGGDGDGAGSSSAGQSGSDNSGSGAGGYYGGCSVAAPRRAKAPFHVAALLLLTLAAIRRKPVVAMGVKRRPLARA
jgi:hypothetical protein